MLSLPLVPTLPLLLPFLILGTKETQENATPIIKTIFTPLSPDCGSTSLPSFARINAFPLGIATLPSSTFSLPYHLEFKTIAEQKKQLRINK